MISKQKNEKENYIDVSNNTLNLHSIKPKTTKHIENTKLPFSSINLMIPQQLTKQPSLRGLSHRNLNFIDKPIKHETLKTEVSPNKIKISRNNQTFLHQAPKLHEKKISQKDIKVSKEEVPVQPSEDERIIKSFCTDIVLYYKDQQVKIHKKKNFLKYPQDYLVNHTIQPALRAKMIDWMVEVLSSYKCQDQTFFIAVSIMDQFLSLSKRSLCPQDIHLIGVTCMFMASKYEEIYPIKLEIVYEKIGHKKLTKEQIKSQECEIINCLNFNLIKITLHEIATLKVAKICIVFNLDKKQKDYLMKCCVMIARMILYDYEFYSKVQDGTNMAHLAGATLMVGIKYAASQQILFESDIISQSIATLFQLEKEKLTELKCMLMRNIQNFDVTYPGLDNLKKFTNFTLPVYKEPE